MTNVSEEILNFINSEYSKEVLPDIAVITEMRGSDSIRQSIDVYNYGDVNYYYSPYFDTGSNKDLDVGYIKSYLDSLYNTIINNDPFFRDELYKEYGDDVKYFSITIVLNFETKKLELSGYGIEDSTDYSQSEFEFTENDDKEIYDVLENYLNQGYEYITVNFSGGGDSGQLDGFYSGGYPIEENGVLEDALYTLLNQHQGGWEINEGSQGEFDINCKDKTIVLNFGMNYEREIDFDNDWEIDLDF